MNRLPEHPVKDDLMRNGLPGREKAYPTLRDMMQYIKDECLDSFFMYVCAADPGLIRGFVEEEYAAFTDWFRG